MNINILLYTISAWGNSIVNGIFVGNIQQYSLFKVKKEKNIEKKW